MKVKDIALGIRMFGGVVNRQQLINIGNSVIRANNSEMFKEFKGNIELPEGWKETVLKSLNWSNRRAATAKVETPAQLLAEEKFTFQKAVAKAIQDNNIQPDLFINLDQTLLRLTRKIYIPF